MAHKIEMDYPNRIWRASKNGAIWLPKLYRQTGAWHEGRPLNYPGMAPRMVFQGEGEDLFFSPLTFEYGRPRANDTVAGPGVMFADLDGVVPEYAFQHVPWPTIMWQTSGGNYQAVWILTRPLEAEDYKRWAKLNRAITRATGADPGGWMGSKVLRVPYSYNYKRGTPERGTVIWSEGNEYDFEELERHFEPWIEKTNGEFDPLQFGPTGDYMVSVPDEDAADFYSIVTAYWKRLPMRVKSWIIREKVADRSVHIWHIATALAEDSDLGESEAYELLYKAPFNKFRDRPRQLLREIGKAYALVRGSSEEEIEALYGTNGEGS